MLAAKKQGTPTDGEDSQPLVLIAEDNPEVRDVMRRTMAREGYLVIEAANGEEALKLFAEEQPDLVLLDAMMPKVDGIQACAQIKSMPGGDLTPVLIVTSLNDSKTIARAFEAGATEYITKPIPFETLRHRIRHLLRARRAEMRLAERNLMLENLNKVVQAAASSLDLNQLMQEVIKVAGGAVNATSAYICDYDAETNTMTVMVEYFSPDATQKEAESDMGITYAIEEHFPTTGKWLQNPDSVHYIQVSDPDLDDIERAEYQQYDAKTVLHIPIFIDGALYGYLEIWESRYERQFTRAEIEMLQTIASQISSSFRNAQLFTALKQSEVALRQQTDDLEARNRELDAYSHTIAHDLKNPLHMVLNYAAFVLEEDGDKLSDESREYMDRVLQFSMNMTVMIDQLLMLAKYRDASEISEPVDMPPVVDHVLEMCSKLIEEKGITVTVTPPLPAVMGHPTWVYEILQNLVSNACKYIGKDNPDPRIDIYAKVQDGNAVYYVRDNGVGITKENQEQLFELFSRFDKGLADGFGLGMSIVTRLLDKMGGSVGVESERGKGSIFRVSLPMPGE